MLKNYEETFTEIQLSELYPLAEKKKAEGARFVQLLATKLSVDDIVLTYTFTDEKVTDHYNVHVTLEDTVPAISPLFLAAFVFENETHDLYGINIEGIAIDFKGNFYQVALDKPMTIDTQDSDMYSVARKYGVEVDGGEA